MRPLLIRRSLLKRSRFIANIVVLLFVLVAGLPPYVANAAEDFSLPNGHFFTQTGDRAGAGFEVRDGDVDAGGHTIRFWSEFQRLGGVNALGYPISRPFRDADGFHYQLFQRALLQWRPEAQRAVLGNLMDGLSANGADDWLASLGIPRPIDDDGSRSNFAKAVDVRLGWLTEPHIKTAFLAAGHGDPRLAIELLGLPASKPELSGPFIVQRFQRITLQVWLDRVAGMPDPGTVVPVLAGDLYRQFAISRGIGLVDGRFLTEIPGQLTGAPAAPPAQRPASRPPALAPGSIDVSLTAALDLLAGTPDGAAIAKALRSPGITIKYQDVPAIALFSANSLSIAINAQYQEADPHTVAAVLAHEGSHLSDYLGGVEMQSPAGCYRTEFTAFETQARVWRTFYGQSGKPAPLSPLDVELNTILDEVTFNPQGFAANLTETYRGECGG